ncbi:inositol monophosphatase family protein [Paenarthrobacter nicotinovorans]|uniref:inositol monophosphatase family protein n=1 Tax=Paenarthrobacter nicotinovorans TaxID=29320 RepID=UPI003818D1B9
MTSIEASELLPLVTAIAHEAGAYQLAHRNNLVIGASKAHVNDLVSDVDIASEKLIVNAILQHRPDDGILGEEGISIPGSSGWQWVIDPIDGTRNYVSGSGPWSVCIAGVHDGETQLAVVYNPELGETFSAVLEGGAFLNTTKIHTSSSSRLDQALLALSFNTSEATKQEMANVLADLLPSVGDIRRYPAALNLAYVAAGRVDAGIILDVKIWDVLAGYLIAKEAGAVLWGSGNKPMTDLTLVAGPNLGGLLRTELMGTFSELRQDTNQLPA